jgi:hypothetical protein
VLPPIAIKSLRIQRVSAEVSSSITHTHWTYSCHYRQIMFALSTLAIAALASFALAGPVTTPPSYLSSYLSPCSSTMCVDSINSCGQTYGGCYPACNGYPTPTFADPGCDPSSTPTSPTYPDPRCSGTVTVTVTESYSYYPSSCGSSSTTATYSSSTSPTGYESVVQSIRGSWTSY